MYVSVSCAQRDEGDFFFSHLLNHPQHPGGGARGELDRTSGKEEPTL